MNGYAFTLSVEEFKKFLNHIEKKGQVYWLRNTLQKREINLLDLMTPFNEFDKSGRLFNESFELQYQHRKGNIQCLLVSEDPLEEMLEGVSYKEKRLIAINNEAKSYFVESLSAITKGETVFKSNLAKVFIKEYKFEDDNSLGYRLCGVR